MQLIEPSVQLITETDPYKKIEMAARTCYKSEKNITEESAKRMVNNLINNQHYAMLEHVNFIFEITGELADDLFEYCKTFKYLNCTYNINARRYLVSGNLRALNESNIIILLETLKIKHPELVYSIDSVCPYQDINNGILILIVSLDQYSDLSEEEIAAHRYTTMKFVTDRGCCYDDKTKVLTKNGWKFFSDLQTNDLIATINDDNNIEWLLPNKIIKQEYNGIMEYWQSCGIDIMVTPNHNMWLYDYEKRSDHSRQWKFIRSEDAKNNRYIFQKSANAIKKTTNYTITIPETIIHKGFYYKTYSALTYNSLLFYEFLGIWITDGCLCKKQKKSGRRIVISQTKKNVRSRIEYLLNALEIPYSTYQNEYRITLPQLYKYLYDNFICNDDMHKTYYVKIPRNIFETASVKELTALLNGIILGDGTKYTNGKGYQIYTASKNFAEDLLELAIYLGKSGKINTVPSRKRTFPYNNKEITCQEQYVVLIKDYNKNLYSTKRNPKQLIDYHGYIYCVELPKYHKLFVMRNGKHCICGNSHELVRHRPFSFAQESTRYVKYGKDNTDILFIKPTDYNNWDWCRQTRFVAACTQAEDNYNYMISEGATPQEARTVLPNALKTEIVITGNEKEWHHFFSLRSHGTTGKPHPDMKTVADIALQLYENYYGK